MQLAYSKLFDLTDRNIWVLGGAGYLGGAVVHMLSQLGAKVLCIDLEGKAELYVAHHELANVKPCTINPVDHAHVADFVGVQIADRGVPDGLVNLSFASTSKHLEELTGEEFDAVNQRGITHTFIFTRAVGKEMMKRQKGSVVLFASMYGSVSPYPDVYRAPLVKNPIEYGVGKAGVIQMTKYLAVHWGAANVRCNSISPGPFPNPQVQHENPDFVERLAEKSPLGRIGKAAEIAGSVAFLLSDASSYITGHNLKVDGGWTCW